MPLSRFIKGLLAHAGNTSTMDDKALDELGYRALEAVILDQETPEYVKKAALRLLRRPEEASSSQMPRTAHELPD